MADRKSLIVVTGVVALGAAALAVVLLWWIPRQDRAEARGQIASWERRWSATRSCLLGEPTLSADPGEALALRELTTGAVHSDISCTEGVQHLMRGQGAASPIDAVEDKWRAVEAAIPALGEAYVMWISAEHDDRDAWLDKLGVAISSLDAAQDELRKTAGMSAIERKGTVTVTRLDAPAPVIAGDQPLHAGARIQAGAIVETVPGATISERLVTGPGAGRALDHPAEHVLAVPDGGWWATEVATPTGHTVAWAATADANQLHELAPTGTTYVAIAAVGSGAERSVVLEDATEAPLHPVALARSSDAGATWMIEDTIGSVGGVLGEIAIDYRAGVVDVQLTDELGTELLHLDAAHPLELSGTRVPDFDGFASTCRRGPALWWKTELGVVRADALSPTVTPGDGDRVIDCTATAALVETGGIPVVYTRCDQTSCKEAMRGSAYSFGRAAMLDDGRVVYAASRGRMIAVWTEGDPDAKFYKLPAPRLLEAVIVWDGVPYAVLTDPDDDTRALFTVRLA